MSGIDFTYDSTKIWNCYFIQFRVQMNIKGLCGGCKNNSNFHPADLIWIMCLHRLGSTQAAVFKEVFRYHHFSYPFAYLCFMHLIMVYFSSWLDLLKLVTRQKKNLASLVEIGCKFTIIGLGSGSLSTLYTHLIEKFFESGTSFGETPCTSSAVALFWKISHCSSKGGCF